MDGFDDKVIIVTGAGGGIGRATAVEFARRNATVIGVDIDEAAAFKTAELVREAGGRAEAVTADVSAPEGVSAYVDAAAGYGRIDVLFNNAAVYTPKKIEEMTLEEFDDEMRINVRSVWLGMKLVIPRMVARRSGSIINTSSVNGLMATPGTAAYTASKHAVIGLTKTVAAEVGASGVRVNAICPAFVDTGMLRTFASASELEQLAREWAPLGRLCRPEEQAKMVAFLASDDASFITGAAIPVDGGALATLATDQPSSVEEPGNP